MSEIKKSRSDQSLKSAVVRSDGKRVSKVKLGNLTITGNAPTPEIVKTNVDLSTAALKRVAKKLNRPGVTIRAKKGVPQFSASELGNGTFTRLLNGTSTLGRFVNGSFEIVD